jgi:hypothetical protein
MGRSYWFECSKCGYRAKVSGKPDRGVDFFVQTISCQDCRELYDPVIRLRVPDEARARLFDAGWGLRQFRTLDKQTAAKKAPRFESALKIAI